MQPHLKSYKQLSLENNYNFESGFTYVGVYTDLSGKELHRQVGVGTVVTAGNLGREMVSMLARIERDVSLIAAPGTIFCFTSHPRHSHPDMNVFL